MKRILIFHGGWSGHEPAECAALFAEKLGARGFAADLTDKLDCLSDAARLKSYDVIMPLWTMGQMTSEQEKNLVAAVQGGVGLAGFHGGMADAFRGMINYQWMVGGQFLAHPENIKDYAVTITRPDDPIVRGIGNFAVHTEQYYMLVDPRNEVLAQTVCTPSPSAPWTEGVVMPVVWKKPFGAGRVFCSALGHKAAEFAAVPQQLEITLRGIAWAAGG